MSLFIEFVGAGLPEAVLRSSSHQKLLETDNQQKIQKAINKVPDQALKQFLASRLEAIRRFQEPQDIQTNKGELSESFLTNFYTTISSINQ